MRAVSTDTECTGCGNMGLLPKITIVKRNDKGAVVECDSCSPNLDDIEEDDPNRVYQIRVRVVRVVWSGEDTAIYKGVLDGVRPKNLPESSCREFSVIAPHGAFRFSKGDVLHCIGRFTVNPKFGFQMQALAPPSLAITESEAGLMAWLTRLPQVGPHRAEAIIKTFGGHAGVIEVLDTDPQKLTLIPGITPERVDEIMASYQNEAGFREFRFFAAELGLKEAQIALAIETWGADAKATIEENPYCLMTLEGVAFKGADAAAQKLGIENRDPRRLAGGVEHILTRVTEEGHTYLAREEFLCPTNAGAGSAARDIQALALSAEELTNALETLSKPFQVKTRKGPKVRPPIIVVEGDRIYPADLFSAECMTAQHLMKLLAAPVKSLDIPADLWADMQPAPEQEQAIQLVCDKNVLIMTGGPGVGKTLTTRKIVELLEDNGLSYTLVAPTGKAAVRMAELIGRPASTIHRQLAAANSNAEGGSAITTKALIVDEASMCDISLIARLLAETPQGTRVIFVGDVDQLPSVGPGRVLEDFIECALVPTVRLTKIFRQMSDGETKRIPTVCADIRNGVMPDLSVKNTDVKFLEFQTSEEVADVVIRAVSEWIPEKYGDSLPVQVISPQRGESGKPNWFAGVRHLNLALQQALNPKREGAAEVYIGDGALMRKGDKVIQKMNCYQKEVFNGESGICVKLETKPFMPEDDVFFSKRDSDKKSGSAALLALVDFGDRVVGYTRKELRELQLAYALTSHAMQGSQSAGVIFVCDSSHKFNNTRRLLYTGVSRAERYVLIVGQASAVRAAINNTKDRERRSTLRARLMTEIVHQQTNSVDSVRAAEIRFP